MLVLARKQNETIVIQNEIEIQVLKVQGKTVRLGIKAPKDVRIVRGELEPLASDKSPSQTTPRFSAGQSSTGKSNNRITPANEGRGGLAKYIKEHPASQRNRQVTMRNLPFEVDADNEGKETDKESFILELPISALKIQAN